MEPGIVGSQALNPSVMDVVGNIGAVGSIFQLAMFLLMAWGLYTINKKGGEQYPWLAFIPVVQIYSFVKAGGKDGIWVLWLILGFIAFIIPGVILYIMVVHSISKRTGNGVGSTLLALIFPYVMYPIMASNMVDQSLNNSMEKETITL